MDANGVSLFFSFSIIARQAAVPRVEQNAVLLRLGHAESKNESPDGLPTLHFFKDQIASLPFEWGRYFAVLE